MSTLNTTNIKTADIRFSQSSKTSLIIEDGGRISTQENPFFYGWRDNGGTPDWETFSTISTYVYNIESENKGGHYNTSTGVFTCPLDGVYLICPSMLAGQGGGSASLYVYKNGVNVTARAIHSNTKPSATAFNVWYTGSYTFSINCAVNDQLTAKISTSNNNVYGVGYSHLSIWYYG